jgi:hypothetical protein
MKKIVFCLMTTCLLLTFHPFQANGATMAVPSSSANSNSAQSAEANVIMLRLEEIKAKDLSKLTKAEKKELRKEVKSISNQVKGPGGIYLSVGALILIVLLLILLL